jgi:hypothetical protein
MGCHRRVVLTFVLLVGLVALGSLARQGMAKEHSHHAAEVDQAEADKFTQPVGDAGSRVAIGVIGIAKSQ